MLEVRDFLVGQGICLGDDWYQVDLGVQSAHDFNVQWLERMTRRLDEVDAGMHAVVDYVHTVDFVLGIEVCVEALFDVLHDRPPRVFVVDEIPEPGGIDYSEP